MARFPYPFGSVIKDFRGMSQALAANFAKALSKDDFTKAGDVLVGTGAGQFRAESRSVTATLPSSPVDGQVCYYQSAAMAAASVVWVLRYNAAGGTYKWEFVGGQELGLSEDGNIATSSTAYVTTGSTLAITNPLAGIYLVKIESTFRGVPGYCSFNVGATTALDADGLYTSSTEYASQARSRQKTIASASQSIAFARRAGAGTMNSDYRRISITPIAVA